jgi:hypothetical protein
MWSAGRFGILALNCDIFGILAGGVQDVSAYWHVNRVIFLHFGMWSAGRFGTVTYEVRDLSPFNCRPQCPFTSKLYLMAIVSAWYFSCFSAGHTV